MTLDDRLGALLTEAADDALPATEAGVHTAIGRRRRRRRRAGTAVAALFVVAGIGAGLALADADGTSDGSGVAGTVQDLPLVGIDLVGFQRAPELDPQPDPSGADLTYAVFTGDEPDVLGPMISASRQPGEPDRVGTPVDLDLDGDDLGPADGRMITFPDGAGITWSIDDEQVASIDGHGVPPEDVVAYAQQLSGIPFDLDEMPPPERLPHREVVTFEPSPDFPFRVATYQGPGTVVSVLTTSDPGYFDLTRIVSTEGEAYERIGFESTFLGPGEAILSPDDDGATSALVRTDGGLIVHAFGQGLDADTLRDAIEQDHLVDLSVEHPATTPTTALTTTTMFPTTTEPGAPSPATMSVVVQPTATGDRLLLGLPDGIPEDVEITPASQPNGGDCNDHPPIEGFTYLTLRMGVPSTMPLARWEGPELLYDRELYADDGLVTAAWTCGWYEGAIYVAIAVDAPVTATLGELPASGNNPLSLMIDLVPENR